MQGPSTPLHDLIQQLGELRSEMLSAGVSELVESAKIRPEHFGSAINLLHYLVLRRHDIRQLQGQLALLGLSSLGRTESHVLSGPPATAFRTFRHAACGRGSASCP